MNRAMKIKSKTITLPLKGLKCLYKSEERKIMVCEINIELLKQVNHPTTIDEMAAEARIEYFAGKTKGFTSTKKLINYLNT